METCRAARAPAAGLVAIVAAGCATQADLAQHQRSMSSAIQEQSRAIAEVARQVERLRADMEQRRGGGKPAATPIPPSSELMPTTAEADRAAKLEERVQQLEQRRAGSAPIGETLSPEGASTEDPTATEQTISGLAARAAAPPAPSAVPPSAAPQQLAALPSSPTATPSLPARTGPTAAPAPRAAIDDDWKREVAQDRAVASTTGGPDRTTYLSALDGLATGDCSKALSRLGSLSTSSSSPLADNALYWRARCSAAEGNPNEAVSSLRTLVSRYPKSDKAPAALWTEGQLLIRLGDVPGARVALAKLIRDYPSTTEATEARRKLKEVEH
jgi:TolA-binding protein